MLVLTRRLNESVILKLPVGEQIVIQVVSLDRGAVRLGIDAPNDVDIIRSELETRGNVKPTDE